MISLYSVFGSKVFLFFSRVLCLPLFPNFSFPGAAIPPSFLGSSLHTSHIHAHGELYSLLSGVGMFTEGFGCHRSHSTTDVGGLRLGESASSFFLFSPVLHFPFYRHDVIAPAPLHLCVCAPFGRDTGSDGHAHSLEWQWCFSITAHTPSHTCHGWRHHLTHMRSTDALASPCVHHRVFAVIYGTIRVAGMMSAWLRMSIGGFLP